MMATPHQPTIAQCDLLGRHLAPGDVCVPSEVLIEALQRGFPFPHVTADSHAIVLGAVQHRRDLIMLAVGEHVCAWHRSFWRLA